MKKFLLPVLSVVISVSAFGVSAAAETKEWKRHSLERPRPPVVTPPANQSPPSDAIVLFDGTNLKAWDPVGKGKAGKNIKKPTWLVKDGYMQVQPPRADIISKQSFGSCQIHIEWATPTEISGSGQGRGNSGVILKGIGEIQVLDSYNNDTYPDGQAGAIYGAHPPLVNASKKPGEWQSFDIIFIAAQIDDGKIVRPAQLTVLHNGLLIHHAATPKKHNKQMQIKLQDHNNPVRYRNIWVREINSFSSH